MDAITLLTNDHRKVEALFKDYTFAVDAKVRKELVEQMVRELSIHAAIEEGAFYPSVRECSTEIRSLVDEGLEEHQQVKNQLSELDSMDPADARFHPAVEQLMGDVKHHVEEEEHQLFPLVRGNLAADKVDSLGDQMERMKATAPTHPHPSAPNLGGPSRMAATASGMMDRARDAMSGLKDEREVRQDVQEDRGFEHPPSHRLDR